MTVATNKSSKPPSKRPLLFCACLSVGVWLLCILYFFLNPADCTPNDGLCNNLQTFWGRVIWGTLGTVFVLPLVLLAALLMLGMVKLVAFLRKRSHGQKPESKKVIILVVSALVVSGAILWAVLLIVSNNRQPVSTLALHKNPDAQAATYNGTPIIEACNIVSFDELRSKGIEVAGAQYPDTFTRTYIEGTQGISPLPDELELQHEPNSCHYQLQKRGDLFNIIVYQPAYSDMEALEAKITSQYDAQPNIGDTRVYKAETYHNRDEDFFNTVSTNEGNEDFILQNGDSALWFRLRDFKPSVREEVLHMIAANFAKLMQKPEARATINYQNSPIKGKLYKACELLTAQNAMQLIGQNLSPVVKEGYGGAPGTRNYQTSHGRPDGHLYVAQECERSASLVPNNRLTLRLRQYATEEGAKHFIQASAAGTNGQGQMWQTAGQNLGDEAYIDPDNTPNGDTIHVRKGSLVLTFSHNLDSYSETKARHTTEQLKSVITHVLERITE